MWIPVIAAGLLMGMILFGVIFAFIEVSLGSDPFAVSWPGWAAMGTSLVMWAVWSVIFFRQAKQQTAEGGVIRQCGYLRKGSMLALLVAVPAHVVARSRDYCCAGLGTFFAIVFGLSVMLLSFGPGVYFLYRARWEQIHPRRPE